MKTALALMVALVAGGCGGNAYLTDDEGAPDPKGSPLGEHPDELSSPYALGTKVKIFARRGDDSLPGWSIRSDSPAVLRVDKVVIEQNKPTAECTAVGEGEARIVLIDETGAEARSATVSVLAADRARAYDHGALRILGRKEESFAQTEVQEPRILAGGKAVFPVAYFRGAQRVYGRGIVTVEASGGLAVENQQTGGDVTNEWLMVTPSVPGSYEIKLKQGASTLLSLPLVGVAEADVASLALTEEVSEKKDDKQQIWVRAQTRDAQNRDVLGVYCGWTLDGVTQTDNEEPAKLTGDLFRYEYQPGGASRALAATCLGQGKTGTLSISAHKGWVSDTTYLGCSTTPGRASGTPWLLALLLLPVALRLGKWRQGTRSRRARLIDRA
jgi:hypothetical protein